MTTSAFLRLSIVALVAWIAGHSATTRADGPIQYSVYQNAPTSDRYAAPPPTGITQPPPFASNAGAPAGTYPNGVAPPPDYMGGVRNTFNDTSDALRRGLESGMQQANQQLSGATAPMFDSVRSLGTDVNNQTQEFMNRAGQPFGVGADDLRNLAEPFVRTAQAGQPGTSVPPNGVSAPPWTGSSSTSSAAGSNASSWTSSSAPVGNGSASTAPPFSPGGTNVGPVGAPREQSVLVRNQNWSVLGSQAPAPPLLTPSLAPPPGSVASQAGVFGSASPSGSPFGVPPGNASFSNSNPAAEVPGGSMQGPLFPDLSSGGTIHSPLRAPGAGSSPGTGFSSGTPFPPPNNPGAERDPFSLPPVQGGPGLPVGGVVSSAPASGNFPPPPSVPAANVTGVNASTANNTPALPPIGANPATARQAALPAPERPAVEGTKTTAAESPKPWMPLVLTMLGLVGSVSANLFLGWSYMDARQKYQTLVRKTADKFRRVAEAA